MSASAQPILSAGPQIAPSPPDAVARAAGVTAASSDDQSKIPHAANMHRSSPLQCLSPSAPLLQISAPPPRPRQPRVTTDCPKRPQRGRGSSFRPAGFDGIVELGPGWAAQERLRFGRECLRLRAVDIAVRHALRRHGVPHQFDGPPQPLMTRRPPARVRVGGTRRSPSGTAASSSAPGPGCGAPRPGRW